MMKVIVVMFNNWVFTQFTKNFQDAFAQLGIEYKIFLVEERQEFANQRKKLCELIDSFHVDKILLINDLHNSDEYFVNEQILKRTKIYVWYVDTLKCYALKNKNLHRYAGIYSFEPEDVEYAKKEYNVDLKYLLWPTGSFYCEKYEQEGIQAKKPKKYDICFVGLVAGCEVRLQALNKLAEHCHKKGYTMALYGHYWHNRHFWQRFLGALKFREKYPKLYPFVHNEYLSPKQSAQLYCDSKISLNIHVERHNGVNCRTFDILGNGNFELCDARDLSLTLLKDKEHLVLYQDMDDLTKAVDYYLVDENARFKIAENGAMLIKQQYQFAKAVNYILEVDDISEGVLNGKGV